jgi:hypothetical protein
MKNSIIFFFTFLFSFYSYSQIEEEYNYNENQVPTTIEIYNYVTKGYAQQIRLGLDDKKGYFFWDKFTRQFTVDGDNLYIDVKALVKEDDFKVVAWMIIFRTDEYSVEPAYFCVPTQSSSQVIWNMSFEDLRNAELTSDGYMVYTWVLYHLVGQMTNDYNKICFVENSLIQLSDGSQKEIKNITKVDKILTFNDVNKIGVINELIIHEEGNYSIKRVELINPNILLASDSDEYFIQTKFFEATPNHPVITNKGIKKVEDLEQGDIMFYYDNQNNTLNEWFVANIDQNSKYVDKVYNLKLVDDFIYFVNGFGVLMK